MGTVTSPAVPLDRPTQVSALQVDIPRVVQREKRIKILFFQVCRLLTNETLFWDISRSVGYLDFLGQCSWAIYLPCKAFMFIEDQTAPSFGKLYKFFTFPEVG